MPPSLRSDGGFSLPELLVAVTLLLIVSSTVTSGLLQMTRSQKTIWNRTQLHAGVRSATELLQQEVGQAGRIALPVVQCPSAPVVVPVVSPPCLTLPTAIAATPATMTMSSTAGVYPGERLLIEPGGNEETVQVSAVNSATQITISRSVDSTDATIQASFTKVHPIGSSVRVYGGFPSGIVPPQPGFANGSTGSVLKLYGDLNSDGNMVYVEYTCDPLPTPTSVPTAVPPGTGNLYRNVMPFNQTPPKPAPMSTQILLGNILSNPNGTACFTYMPSILPVVNGNTYVLDVAITLTVQTQTKDVITNAYQTETKALLNVSPRNVFNVWQLASAGTHNRVQPMPLTVTALLP